MLKTETIRSDPNVGQILFAATSKVTSLAKAATEEPPETRGDHAEDHVLQLQEDLAPLKVDERIPLNYASSGSDFMAEHMGGGIELLSPRLPLSFAGQSTLSSKGEIFGNGWFGLKPSLSHYSFRGASRDDHEGTFALKLLQTTLNLAYLSLLESSGDPASVAMRICRFALLYHSREEILFNLRWFLGPGYLAIPSLSRAIFGFDHTLSVQHLNAMASRNEAKIFSPFVDAQALVEAPSKLPRHAFMNAWDIEEYLRSKGAAHFDHDVLQIRVQWPGDAERIDNFEQNFDEIPPEFGVLGKHHYFEPVTRPAESKMLNIFEEASSTSYFAPESSNMEFQTTTSLNNRVFDSNSNSSSKVFDSFDFNALLEGPDRPPRIIGSRILGRPATSAIQTRTVHLSTSTLLGSLARNSVCLGTGPGFPRASVDMAIESAIRTTQVY
jgi:hypothetical protein